jgi:hypothetical protein
MATWEEMLENFDTDPLVQEFNYWFNKSMQINATVKRDYEPFTNLSGDTIRITHPD